MKMEKKRFTYNSSDNIIEEDGEFLAYLTESNVHCILGRLEELYNVNEGMRDYIEHNREVCLELLEEQGKSKVSWFEWILEHLFEIFLVEVFIMLQFIIICFLLSLFGVI